MSPASPTDRPRERSLSILQSTERGGFADPLLDEARREFNARDCAFILELVNGVLRNRSLLDWTLDRFSEKPVAKTDAATRNILRLSLYQMLFLDRVPVSAAVNTAADLAKTYGKKPGYVNGLLRRIERNRAALPLPAEDDPLSRLSVIHSHPAWLVRRWLERFGMQQAEEMLSRNNQPAPLIIRTNTLKGSRDELLSLLEAQGASARATACSPAGVELLSSPGIASLKAYRDGWFLVQDEAAQLVSLLLSPEPGETVLDACAAPGGKATHLAELMRDNGRVIALESDRKRAARIGENSGRLGLTIVKPVIGDAAAYREGMYDRILVDAPCSGLGVLRRHPDGRWTKTEESIRERAALQAKILKNCAKLLKPGGMLVYATCTTEPEENESVINDFIAASGGEFRIDDPRPFLPDAAAAFVGSDGFFRTFPKVPAMDGFYGARMVRG